MSVPSSELGPPTSSPASECSSPGTKCHRRGGTLACGWGGLGGGGGPNLDRWRKKWLAPTYCSDPLGRRDDFFLIDMALISLSGISYLCIFCLPDYESLNDVSRPWGADVKLRTRVLFVLDALIWWSIWWPEAEFINAQFRWGFWA